LAEALALSHLVTGAVKVKTGRLTPVCGCAVAAGSGAAAALTRLAGGDARQSESAVAYVLAALMGMVCDGAKFACSLMVATASAEAFDAAMLAVHGAPLRTREGLVGPDFLDNARAVGELCGMGFAAVDGVIMRILGGTSGPLAEK
jgi:L-cysteine desulfidase